MPVHDLVYRFASTTVYALYVPICAWCGRRGDWICDRCIVTVAPIAVPGCARCGVTDPGQCECGFLPPEIQTLRSIYPFGGWVRAAIHKFKFEGQRARADSLAEQFSVLPDALRDADAIVAVPMHRDRLRMRGYNQAELLAVRVGAIHGLPVIVPLERTIDRGSQVGRSLPERWLAVDGVFHCRDKAIVRGRRIVVIDDVITTGATISSCATVLMQAGAAEVRGLSLARG